MLKHSLLLASICLLPAPLAAGIIYSNVSASFPGDVYMSTTPGTPYVATAFTATSSGTLAAIQTDFCGGATTAGLYTNSAGQPGTLLESWSVGAIGCAGFGFPPSTEPVLNSALNPTLSAGTQYWFVLSGGAPTWDANDTSSTAGGLWMGDSLTGLTVSTVGFDTPGIEVDSSSTPEPSTGLLLIGPAAWFFARRRRKS